MTGVPVMPCAWQRAFGFADDMRRKYSSLPRAPQIVRRSLARSRPGLERVRVQGWHDGLVDHLHGRDVSARQRGRGHRGPQGFVPHHAAGRRIDGEYVVLLQRSSQISTANIQHLVWPAANQWGCAHLRGHYHTVRAQRCASHVEHLQSIHADASPCERSLQCALPKQDQQATTAHPPGHRLSRARVC